MRILLTLTLLFIATTALAADPATIPTGLELSKSVYCDIKSLFNGSLGLLAGFAIALYGLFQIIQGSTSGGIFFIVAGAAVTMLPNLIESTLGGLKGVLGGISTGGGFDASGTGCANPSQTSSTKSQSTGSSSSTTSTPTTTSAPSSGMGVLGGSQSFDGWNNSMPLNTSKATETPTKSNESKPTTSQQPLKTEEQTKKIEDALKKAEEEIAAAKTPQAVQSSSPIDGEKILSECQSKGLNLNGCMDLIDTADDKSLQEASKEREAVRDAYYNNIKVKPEDVNAVLSKCQSNSNPQLCASNHILSETYKNDSFESSLYLTKLYATLKNQLK
ncbi:MAG: hypothetical protein WAZ18_01545 [Alphaproteobacteria bacterium]